MPARLAERPPHVFGKDLLASLPSTTPDLQSPGNPTGPFHAVHQRAAPDISLPIEAAKSGLFPAPQYTSVRMLEDPESVQVCPRSSNAKKRLSGRRVRSASRSIIMISDRDTAFSASQKASLDKCARMRSKMTPMFTISRGPFPHPATAVGYTRFERNGSPGTATGDSRKPLQHAGSAFALRSRTGALDHDRNVLAGLEYLA